MKISKLLNRKYLSIISLFLTVGFFVSAEDKPIDIWDTKKVEEDQNLTKKKSDTSNDTNQTTESSIYDMQTQKKDNSIIVDQKIDSKEIKIVGLYDPEDYDLKIDMWINSDGDQLKNIFSNINNLNLSKDAAELMNILLLTNAYYPKKNITEMEFLNIKSNWLIKKKNLDLIEKYITKNQIINSHPELVIFLVDHYLSEANLSKSCEIFENNSEPINNKYLSKFKIYCLINNGQLDEAQLILDLKKEIGFKDEYFENKINFLLNYTNKVDQIISEKNMLDFHLAHRTNPEFMFDPDDKTNKQIWKYLLSSNLLYKTDDIDLSELDKISLIEKATHEKNYLEDDLFEIYKRFQFNLSQLLNAANAYKTLGNIESRALIYQKILLESEIEKKLEFIEILKDLFIKENLSNAFDTKLKELLKNLNADEVPSKYKTFYLRYVENKNNNQPNIKYNNDILHQSKLVNYFNGDYTKSKIEKELNNFLKKIKKNKKYFLSKKDIILIESLKSDGVKISKKYENLYKIDDSEIPTDIQVMINNNETAASILRIIEVIGQDTLEALDEDTLFFIISTLNQLNIDFIRDNILLKVLPLKV